MLGVVLALQATPHSAPPIGQQSSNQAKPAGQGYNEANAAQAPPGSKSAPLYVEADCQHGCGYPEDSRGWLERLGTDPTATFTGVLAIFTAGLIGVGWLQWGALRGQVARLDQTIANSNADSTRQAADMKASITEAARAATAMASVAHSLKINAEQIVRTVKTNETIAFRQKIYSELQLRAYLSVVIGGAIFQERDKGWKFEGKPRIVNVGNTVAKNVRWRKHAAILPIPVPEDAVLYVSEFFKGLQ